MGKWPYTLLPSCLLCPVYTQQRVCVLHTHISYTIFFYKKKINMWRLPVSSCASHPIVCVSVRT